MNQLCQMVVGQSTQFGSDTQNGLINNLNNFKLLLDNGNYDELYNKIKNINGIDQILDGIAKTTKNK